MMRGILLKFNVKGPSPEDYLKTPSGQVRLGMKEDAKKERKKNASHVKLFNVQVTIMRTKNTGCMECSSYDIN